MEIRAKTHKHHGSFFNTYFNANYGSVCRDVCQYHLRAFSSSQTILKFPRIASFCTYRACSAFFFYILTFSADNRFA